MNQSFEAILDDCLSRMRVGEGLEVCLAAHPEQAHLLRPLLLAADQVRRVPMPRARPQAAVAGREAMLAAYRTKTESGKVHRQDVSFGAFPRYTQRAAGFLRTILIGKGSSKMKLAVRIAVDVLVILVIGSAVTLNASARSLPGDPAYGFKRSWEQVRLSLTLDEEARQQLENRFAGERREEVQSLIRLGRQQQVEFSGVLESIEAERWTVNGMVLDMNNSTTIEGEPGTGQTVRVLALVQDNGMLLALNVRTEVLTGPEPKDPVQGQTPGTAATPLTTGSPAPTKLPMHTQKHTASPSYTPAHTPVRFQEAAPSQSPVPTHHAEPTHHIDPTHEPRPTDPPPQPDPTRHLEPTHQPAPTHHDEPSHEPDPGHPHDPPHDEHH